MDPASSKAPILHGDKRVLQGAAIPTALPAPCLTCGAPMEPTDAEGLHGDPTLNCAYCGRSESMPADKAAQHRHLRLRLLQIQRTREAIEAPLKTFNMVRQAWAFGLVPIIIIGGYQAWQIFQTPRGLVPLQSLIFALIIFSVVPGVLAGYVGMMRTFKRLVRPYMLARPPLEQGLAARCRTCGGHLPPVRTPSVICTYCHANNFLDSSLARNASDLLAAERVEYDRRARGGQPDDGSAFQQPGIAFNRWMTIGAAISFVLGLAILLVLRSSAPTGL
jgi:hypothetical protein